MNADFRGCKFHYAALPGYIMITRNGVDVTPKESLAYHEALYRLQEHRRTGHVVLVDTVTYGHVLFHGHSGHVQIYAWESVWTVWPLHQRAVRVQEVTAPAAALSAASAEAINAGKPGRIYRVLLGGENARNMSLLVRARSAKRAMQFAYAYARCRWLNNKGDPQRDTRRVWITECFLYANS